MIKKWMLALALFSVTALGSRVLFAQPADILKGFWGINSTGQALLGSPSGTCTAAGLTPGSLFDGTIFFDGQGSLNGSGTSVGISIGETTCTAPNYFITGSYTFTDKGDGSFEVKGLLSTNFVGRSAACAGTTLTNQPFTLVGKISEHSFTFTTAGAGEGSTYAEGPAAGPISCSAPILNFATSGTGIKFGSKP
jgi:hypothetical protein